jgi:hypothetical protein
LCGAGGRCATRTRGLWFRRPTLYPPELIAHAMIEYVAALGGEVNTEMGVSRRGRGEIGGREESLSAGYWLIADVLFCDGEIEHALVEDLINNRHDRLGEHADDEDGRSHHSVDHVGAEGQGRTGDGEALTGLHVHNH